MTDDTKNDEVQATGESEEATESAHAQAAGNAATDVSQETGHGPKPSGPSLGQRSCIYLIMLVVGVAAGIISGWLFGLAADWFVIGDEFNQYSPPYSGEIAVRFEAASERAARLNLVLGFGFCGCVAGAAIGWSAGLINGTWRSGLCSLGLGVVLGGAFGALGGLLNRFASAQFTDHSQEAIFTAMKVHAAGWLLIALAIGLAVGLPTRRWKTVLSCVGVAIAAAIIAVVLFPVLSSVLIPEAHPEIRIPDRAGVRLLWTTLSCGLIALALGRQRMSVHAI